jgi:hypothetical protein
MHVADFTSLIVLPTLKYLSPVIPYSDGAAALLVYTAITESGLSRLTQLGNGPALGFWQVELPTHADVLRWAERDAALLARVLELRCQAIPSAQQLVGNTYYACAIARLIYRRAPEPIPSVRDHVAMAKLWKRRYNTPAGKGTVERFVAVAERHEAAVLRGLGLTS